MCKKGNTAQVIAHHVGEIRCVEVQVDKCISKMVQALNDKGVATKECCCGHGEKTGHITLTNGKILAILPNRKAYEKILPIDLNKP